MKIRLEQAPLGELEVCIRGELNSQEARLLVAATAKAAPSKSCRSSFFASHWIRPSFASCSSSDVTWGETTLIPIAKRQRVLTLRVAILPPPATKAHLSRISKKKGK